MFSYLQLLERLKVNKRVYGCEYCKTEFEIELCINDEHVIDKIHKLLLKFEKWELVNEW